MADDNPYQRDYLSQFFDKLGIPAYIETDSNQAVTFVVETAAFERRRALVEAWFIVVEEGTESCRLRERMRGTGKTT